MRTRIFLLALLVAAALSAAAAQRREPPPERPRPAPDAEPKADAHLGSISRIRVRTLTGGDDLRRESRVQFFVVARDGRRLQSPPLNCVPAGRGREARLRCAGIPNNTRRTFEWDLSGERPPLRPEDVHRFGVAFEGGRSGPFDTGDNWNLDALEVEYVVHPAARGGRPATRQMLRLAGGPLYRFKTKEEWESEPLRLGAEGILPGTIRSLPTPGGP